MFHHKIIQRRENRRDKVGGGSAAFQHIVENTLKQQEI